MDENQLLWDEEEHWEGCDVIPQRRCEGVECTVYSRGVAKKDNEVKTMSAWC